MWLLDNTGGYAVRGAYDLLTTQAAPNAISAMDLVWQSQVPLKVSVFAWRLLRDRLPTKSNLAAKGVIPHDATLRVVGCDLPESAQHLFLLCNTFGSLWELVRDWIGCSGADTNNIYNHLLQFTLLTEASKARRSFMQLIWLLCA